MQGLQRFRIFDYIQTEPFLIADGEFLTDAAPPTQDFEARVIHLRQQVHRALSLLPASLNDIAAMVDSFQEASGLIDFVASWLDIPLAEKQEVLETLDLESRLKKVSEKLTRQVEILEMTRKISSEAKGAMDRSQREYLLREQLKAIHKELGESDGKAAEIQELREKVVKAKMPAQRKKRSKKSTAWNGCPKAPRNTRWCVTGWIG